MNLEANTRIALIYLIFFLTSAFIAFLLFMFLPSDVGAQGHLFGINFNATGATAAFIISFLVLHFGYTHFFPKTKHILLEGNVLDEAGSGVAAARVSVSQERGETLTDSGGYFGVRVNNRDSWTLKAEKDGYELREAAIVKANKTHEPINIILKKKQN